MSCKQFLVNSTLSTSHMRPGSVTIDSEPGTRPSRPPKGKRTVISKYTRHACAQCRKAKARCQGGEPICERCQKMGHECNWSVEDARRPLTRAHEQALKHQNALLRAEVERLTQEVEALRLHAPSASRNTQSVSSITSIPNPDLRDVHRARSEANHRHNNALSASDSTGASAIGYASPSSCSAPVTGSPERNFSARTSNQGTGTSPQRQLQMSPPARTDRTDQAFAEDLDDQSHSRLWAIVPIEDIASDAQEHQDVEDEHNSRPGHTRMRKETGFECDVESAYESAFSDRNDEGSEGSEDEDSSDNDSDSDVDVDKALAAPTKTLFTEHDDLHHYGLTSVFRLRRPTSRKNIRRGLRHSEVPVDGLGSAASGYESISSSQGFNITSRSKSDHAQASGVSRTFRSFLSSSSAKEASSSNLPKPAFFTSNVNASPVDGGPFSDTAATERFNKRNRKVRRASQLLFSPVLGPGLSSDSGIGTDMSLIRSRTRTRTRERIRTRFRETSPVRTQKHILLVDDAGLHENVGTRDQSNVAATSWKGCDCQSECWSRWLPKGVPLSRKEHDTLLDRIFLFFTSWCMRLIPEYFLRDMYTFLHPSTHPSSQHTLPPLLQPRLAHYSPFLHNTILAVATAFSSSPVLRSSSTRNLFAQEAKAYLEEECSRPNISTVQALGILASYYSGQGQQTLGFMYFGMSARIAQALGLFADCTMLMRSGRLGMRQVFDRTWCFHMAAAQDTCWSLYVGRECGIPLPAARASASAKKSQNENQGGADEAGSRDTRADVQRGRKAHAFSMDDPFCLGIISEGGIGDDLDRMTWRSRRWRPNELPGEEPESVPQCKTFTTLQWSCQLMKIGRSIMDLMNRLASSDNATEIKLLVADIDIQLDAWRQDLPPELKLTPANEMTALPHKLMMHAAFWWQHILLHRPFYQRRRNKSTDSVFSVTRCNVAAREILSVLRLWRKIYGTVRYCPITLIQAIFAAGTIYILQSMQASAGRRPATQTQASALDNLEELLGFLRECAESWEAAVRIADIFERILNEQMRRMENMLRGVHVSGEGGKRRKKRRLEALREDEVAVLAARSALVNHTPALETVATVSDDTYGVEASTSLNPQASTASTDINANRSQFVSSSESQQTLFSPSVASHADVSPVFSSCMNSPFRNDAQSGAQLPGAHIPTYPTGYLSDESYMSDTPYMYTGAGTDGDIGTDVWSSFSPLVNAFGLSRPTPSTIPNIFEYHNAASGFHDALSFNSEINMDAVMPGMGLLFEFDPVSSLPSTSVGSNPNTHHHQHQQQLQTGFGTDFDTARINVMDSFTFSTSDVEGLSGGGYTSTGTTGVQGDFDLDMDVGQAEAEGEGDRALYELLAALNGHHQF